MVKSKKRKRELQATTLQACSGPWGHVNISNDGRGYVNFIEDDSEVGKIVAQLKQSLPTRKRQSSDPSNSNSNTSNDTSRNIGKIKIGTNSVTRHLQKTDPKTIKLVVLTTHRTTDILTTHIPPLCIRKCVPLLVLRSPPSSTLLAPIFNIGKCAGFCVVSDATGDLCDDEIDGFVNWVLKSVFK